MANIVAKCRHSKDSAPVRKLILAARDDLPDRIVDVFLGSDYPKNPFCKLHHTKRVLKPLVSSTRVDQVRQSQLMNVPEALKRPRIENHSLV